MKIKIGSRELNLTSASILRTMDTGADEWSAIIPMPDPNIDQELYNLIKPRSLSESEAWIAGTKLGTGNKYITVPSLTNSGAGVELRCYSKTFRLIKSNPKEQKEFNQVSLLDITKEFAGPFGFSVKYGSEVESEVNEIFENEKIGAQQTVFDFLQNLARQRGILTSSDVDGNLIYLKAQTGKKSVGSIVEGEDGSIPVTSDFRATFDDTEVFQVYQAVASAPWAFDKSDPGGISKDTRINIPSFKTITTNSTVEGGAQAAVDFSRNQTLVKALTIPFDVNTWYAPNGELWRENTLVSVMSPTLFIPDGFTFLIRAVQFNLDSGGGMTANLSLVPPSLYTDEAIVEPWA